MFLVQADVRFAENEAGRCSAGSFESCARYEVEESEENAGGGRRHGGVPERGGH